MIGSVFNVSVYSALYGAGSVSYGTAADSNASRLLDGAGALQGLDSGRSSIEAVKAALTKLRDALQAARDQVSSIPGRTEFKPVVADIAQTVDKTVYGTVDGGLVEAGTIRESRGTRSLVVGYERTNRTPVNAGGALEALVANVATLVSRVGANGAGGFAADVSALLRSSELTTAVNRPDAGAIGTAIARIDDVLARTDGLRFSIGTRASVAALVDLGGLLLGAAPDTGGEGSQ